MKYIFGIFGAFFTIGVVLAAHSYGDVNSGKLYSEAIDFISNKGIVQGYPDGTYQPDRTLNRAELLKIVVEAEYDNEFENHVGENCFKDVPAGEWFSKYVCFAKAKSIVKGYSDGTFKPDQKINFVEALKISLSTFGIQYDALYEPWYKDMVIQGGKKNLIPLSVKYFDQNFSRGQMAEMITRILKEKDGTLAAYIKDDAHVSYEKMVEAGKRKIVFNGNDGCFDNPNICGGSKICVRNTCIEKNALLPSNGEASAQNCSYDEVYINSKCEKAAVSVAMVAFDDAGGKMDEWVDNSVGAFVALSGLSTCPNKVRVYRDYNMCLPNDSDVGKEVFKRIGGPVQFFMIGQQGDKNKSCEQGLGSEGEYSGWLNMISTYSPFTHEMGHEAGLYDQYCYLPADQNPNIVNFKSAACKVPDDQWLQEYCGRADLGGDPANPYTCDGDINNYGGRSIMGFGDYSISSSLTGYSPAEEEYVAEKFNCY